MDWTDNAIVLSSRRHGETSAIVNVLTPNHGRYTGLVRGGGGKNQRGMLQPGNLIKTRWRARLPEHLGTFTCELLAAYSAGVLDQPVRLVALQSACAVAATVLPEREVHNPVFQGMTVLLESLGTDADTVWPLVYVKWELGLLSELGFGLDFRECAATGVQENLTHVSPRSGKAVSAEAAKPYLDKLLPLPAFLISNSTRAPLKDALDGMRLTGHFLKTHVYNDQSAPPPEARARFVQSLRRTAEPSQ